MRVWSCFNPEGDHFVIDDMVGVHIWLVVAPPFSLASFGSLAGLQMWHPLTQYQQPLSGKLLVWGRAMVSLWCVLMS